MQHSQQLRGPPVDDIVVLQIKLLLQKECDSCNIKVGHKWSLCLSLLPLLCCIFNSIIKYLTGGVCVKENEATSYNKSERVFSFSMDRYTFKT